jgi:hypothetical protein
MENEVQQLRWPLGTARHDHSMRYTALPIGRSTQDGLSRQQQLYNLCNKHSRTISLCIGKSGTKLNKTMFSIPYAKDKPVESLSNQMKAWPRPWQ